MLAGKNLKFGVTPVSAEDLAILQGDSSENRRSALNRLLFPAPTKEYLANRDTYGNLDQVDTVDYLYGLEQGHEHVVEIAKGVQLFVGLEAIGSPDAKGNRTVMATLNGQLRPIDIRDKKISVDVPQAEKADASNIGHIAAPFSGAVTVTVVEGVRVEIGQPVAIIEAMKMEATITATMAGVVRRIAIPKTQSVEAGDLILVVESE